MYSYNRRVQRDQLHLAILDNVGKCRKVAKFKKNFNLRKKITKLLIEIAYCIFTKIEKRLNICNV